MKVQRYDRIKLLKINKTSKLWNVVVYGTLGRKTVLCGYLGKNKKAGTSQEKNSGQPNFSRAKLIHKTTGQYGLSTEKENTAPQFYTQPTCP